MNIDHINLEKVPNFYQKQQRTEKNINQQQKDIKKDQMTISQKAQEFKIIQAEIKKIPEIRQEKVAVIKEKLADGQYNIDSSELAKKIMESINRE